MDAAVRRVLGGGDGYKTSYNLKYYWIALRHVLRHLQKVVVEERKEWGFRLVVVRWKSVYKINYIIEKYGKLFVFWSC